MDRFDACLAQTLRWEGGWSDHPRDRGGPTMRGVTIRVYAGFLGVKLTEKNGVLVRDAAFHSVRERLRLLPDEHLRNIYRRQYWNVVRGDDLPAGVDLAVFDFAVNSGPTRAAKYLQKVVGVKQDGHIGEATLGAVRGYRSMPQLVQELMRERRAYLRRCDDYPVFGKGWENRCDGIEPVALDMAGDVVLVADPWAVKVQPIEDANAQAETQGRAEAADPKPPKATEVTLGVTGLSSTVSGWASFFGKVGAMQAPTVKGVVFALLSEPLILTGLVMVFSALVTYLWRRRFA